MELVINIDFKNIKEWKDSFKRAEHIKDRMKLRGIFTQQIKETIQKGAKNLKKDGTIIAEFRWFKVAYREFIIKNIRKIYPITVMES